MFPVRNYARPLAGKSNLSELNKCIDKKPTGSYRWWGWGRSAGSRRTAAHCGTRWWAWLRIEHNWFCSLAVWTDKKKETKKKRRENKYILFYLKSQEIKKKNAVVSSPSFRAWDVLSSASGAVARCGSSKLRCPCVRDERLHPTAEVRSATWTDRGLGGKERERETEGRGEVIERKREIGSPKVRLLWHWKGGRQWPLPVHQPPGWVCTPHPTVSPPPTHLLLPPSNSLYISQSMLLLQP